MMVEKDDTMDIDRIVAGLETSPTFCRERMGFTLDISGMGLPRDAVAGLLVKPQGAPESPVEAAHRGMREIEAGEIKNPDQARQVTHFTDRLTYCDDPLCRDVEAFAEAIRSDPNVESVIVNGIGGSALGPQLLQFAVNGPHWNELPAPTRNGYPRIYFIDNTDPAGLADVKAAIDLARTIVISISKSGGTQETKNNIAGLEQAFTAAGEDFAAHAVAITMRGSTLWDYAADNGWRKVFPMAESIGGRTSETNIVGHVPAALTGIDFAAFVDGARAMDEWTRVPGLADNPAYQLAVAWYVAGDGRGDRNMAIVPYSDRLVLLGKYLQQLVMESLGKELDLDRNVVHQGLTVYGNKGGTDAHAYIQQLNDGRDDFFLTFVEPLADAEQIPIADGFTMGDYLHAFKEGLRQALRRKGRQVIDVVVERVNEESLGMVIALYERAVAFYAELININAFHQPGVAAYKDASGQVNDVNRQLQTWLRGTESLAVNAPPVDIASAAGLADQQRDVAGLLAKFAVNGRHFGGRVLTRKFRDGGWQYTLAEPPAG